jgi:hypothetical protein
MEKTKMEKVIFRAFLFCTLCGFVLTGCETAVNDTVESAEKSISVFILEGLETAETAIDETNKSIVITVPYGTTVEELIPQITHTGRGIRPESGVVQDFSGPVTYTVTAADGSVQEYTVTIAVLEPLPELTGFDFIPVVDIREGETNAGFGMAAGVFNNPQGGSGVIVYTLAGGEGGADNNRFTIAGTELKINVPALNAGTYSVRVQAKDTQNKVFIKQLAVEVLARYPELTGINVTPASLREGEAGAASGALAGTLSNQGGTAPIIYTLVGGEGDTHNNRFTITGTELYIGASALTEGIYSVRVQAQDTQSKVVIKQSTITVLEYHPEIVGFSFTPAAGIREGEASAAPGALAGTVSDPQGGSGVIAYTLVSGEGDADNGRFTLAGTALYIGGTAVTEGTYTIRIQAGDTKQQTYVKQITIAVLARYPEITGFDFDQVTLREYESTTVPGAQAGILNPQGGTGLITYTLVDGEGDTDNGRFTLAGAEVRIGTMRLLKGSYTIRVQAADTQGKRFIQPIAITVVDAADPVAAARKVESPDAAPSAALAGTDTSGPVKAAIKQLDIEDSTPDKTVSTTASKIITLIQDGSTTNAGSSSVTITGNTIKIKEAGTYSLSGTLSNGKVIVDVEGAQVFLIFNGVSITSNDGAPLAIFGTKKKVITLAAGTQNTLTDAAVYTDYYTGDEPNGALFSKKALTINGTGSLTVKGNNNNGISCKDNLKIMSGTITVQAKNNALKGNDSIVIKGGTLNLTSDADGMKADSVGETKGYVYIENADLTITAAEDAIQAYRAVWIAGANTKVTGKAGGGSTGAHYEGSGSAKGIKVEGDLLIEGGTVTIDSLDDAVNIDGTASITGGTLTIRTDDDAIHVVKLLVIENGTIAIPRSYEGLESKNVIIKGGTITITAENDGINASVEDGSSTAECNVFIDGGTVTINSAIDAIDANGAIVLSGGTVTVTHRGDHTGLPLDADRGIVVTGGQVYAVSAGNNHAPAGNSAQKSVVLTAAAVKAAGTRIRINNSTGIAIVDFTAPEPFSSLMISSNAFADGELYTLYVGETKITRFTLPYTVSGLQF